MASFFRYSPHVGRFTRPDMRSIPNTEITTMCCKKTKTENKRTRDNAGRAVEVPGVCSRFPLRPPPDSQDIAL
jgi:hypothetical protein